MCKYLLFAMLLGVYERESADVLMAGVIFPVAVYCSPQRVNRVVYGKISEVITETYLRNAQHLFLAKC